jgi:hypothetical protein
VKNIFKGAIITMHWNSNSAIFCKFTAIWSKLIADLNIIRLIINVDFLHWIKSNLKMYYLSKRTFA